MSFKSVFFAIFKTFRPNRSTTITETTTTMSTSQTTTTSTSTVGITTTTTTKAAVPTGPNFCEAKYYRNVYWPKTREGLTAVMSCPINTTGTTERIKLVRLSYANLNLITLGVATWKCEKTSNGAKFTPENPDLAGCKHAWVNDLDLQVIVDNKRCSVNFIYGIFPQITRKQPAVKIVDFVNEKLKTSEHLYGGDLTSLIDTVSQLISLQNDQLKLHSRSSNPFQRSTEALNFTKVTTK